MTDPEPSLPKERPLLRGVDPHQCKHPKLVPLLEYRGFSQILYRCMVCGRTMTTSDLAGKAPWERGRRP